MRLVVLSRQFNRIGYDVLETLLSSKNYQVALTILPDYPENRLDAGFISNLVSRLRYSLICLLSGAKNIKMQDSIIRLCRKHNSPLIKCNDINSDSIKSKLSKIEFDMLIVAGGWPRLIGKDVIGKARIGGMNIHPSILPKFRGTSVHRWQILEGERTSGVTFHELEDVYDSGDIILQKSFDISNRETPQSLVMKASKIASGSIEEAIRKFEQGGIISGIDSIEEEQWPRWNWEEDSINWLDWNLSAEEIDNIVRSCNQESYHYGGPKTKLGNSTWIIRDTEVIEGRKMGILEPGVFEFSRDGSLLVECGRGSIVKINRLQKTIRGKNSLRSIKGNFFARFSKKNGLGRFESIGIRNNQN